MISSVCESYLDVSSAGTELLPFRFEVVRSNGVGGSLDTVLEGCVLLLTRLAGFCTAASDKDCRLLVGLLCRELGLLELAFELLAEFGEIFSSFCNKGAAIYSKLDFDSKSWLLLEVVGLIEGILGGSHVLRVVSEMEISI